MHQRFFLSLFGLAVLAGAAWSQGFYQGYPTYPTYPTYPAYGGYPNYAYQWPVMSWWDLLNAYPQLLQPTAVAPTPAPAPAPTTPPQEQRPNPSNNLFNFWLLRGLLT